MQTKIVKIREKEYKIKEISLDDSLELGEIKNPKDSLKKLLEIAVEPSITEEERKNITMREGLELIKEINKLNGMEEGFLLQPRTQSSESGN